MEGVRWGSRCEGFCSKEGPHYSFEQSARNPTINLIHKFENPLGISYPSCTAKLSGAYVMQERVSSRIFAREKGMIRICPADVCTRNLWREAKSVLLKETHTFLVWGCTCKVLPCCAKGTRNGTRNWISMQPKNCAIKLVSSDLAKILEEESSN